MKKWHFKKWFQIVLEVITALDFLCLIGISDIEGWAGIIVFMLMAIVLFINGRLLTLYGVYKED